MATLPMGTVTFLFTDIEGSTQQWEARPEAMKVALGRHHAILRAAIEGHQGVVFQTVGDAFCAAFASAPEALQAALDAQRGLAAEPWQGVEPIRVRMALHTGIGEHYGENYNSLPLNRISRLLSSGYGGQVLLSLDTQVLVQGQLPPDVQLRDLGEHRLRSLLHPMHIFQLVADDLPASFPPLKTLTPPTPPSNLPTPRTTLIGRAAEVAAVSALLRQEGVSLVTLTGPGGTGKTRLSVEVASELRGHFAHGVFFVALAPISAPDMVIPTIAQTLGVKDLGGRPVLEALQGFLADKHTLLVLDNFEQVIAAAPQVGAVLEAAPALKVLVTSREVLHLYGEQEYPVPPLALPSLSQPQESPAQWAAILSQYAAVALFCARAQAARPGFQLTNENAPVVAEICMRLDGLPLAIELAAARIKVFSPQQLQTKLGQRLQVLTGGARDLPARQQTLRGAIAWSYDLLSPAEQQFFAMLAVFVGGFTADAAEAVLQAIDTQATDSGLEVLYSLVDKSLVRRVEPTEEHIEGEPRFRLLETIREYALTQWQALSEEVQAQLRQRHASYYLAWAERLVGAHKGAWGFPWDVGSSRFHQAEQEHDNLRAAVGWAIAQGASGQQTAEAVEVALRLGVALAGFWLGGGFWREGRRWLVAALDLQPPTTMEERLRPIRARALFNAGVFAHEQGDDAQARLYLEESFTLLQTVGDRFGCAEVLRFLGHTITREDPDRAITLFEQSLALSRELGDHATMAFSLLILGRAMLRRGALARASQHCAESFALFQALEDQNGQAHVLRLMGEVALKSGDAEAARGHYEASLALFRTLGKPEGCSQTLMALSQLALHQGQSAQTRVLSDEAVVFARTAGDIEELANALLAQAVMMKQLGDVGYAYDLYAEALTLNWNLGRQRGMAECFVGLAGLASLRGAPARAAHLLGAAEALFTTLGTDYRNIIDAGGVATIQQQLGADAFAAAWRAGQGMTREHTVKYALEQGEEASLIWD